MGQRSHHEDGALLPGGGWVSVTIAQMLELMPSCRTPGTGSMMTDIFIAQSPSVTFRKQNYEEPVKAALYSG